MKQKEPKSAAFHRKVSNTSWGLETRILAMTTHALMESVAHYGLATFGGHITKKKDVMVLGTMLLKRAARRVIGTGTQ